MPPEHGLPDFLEYLLAQARDDGETLLAVRWLNRLYYDIHSWHLELLEVFRRRHRAGRIVKKDPLRWRFLEEYRSFLESMSSKAFPPAPIRVALPMLARRFPVDFYWLWARDEEAYAKALATLRMSYADHRPTFALARRLLQELLADYRQEADSYASLRDYLEQVDAAVSRLHQIGAVAGRELLSVEEYNWALVEDGSRNARLMVLGEFVGEAAVQDAARAAERDRARRRRDEEAADFPGGDWQTKYRSFIRSYNRWCREHGEEWEGRE